MAELDKNAAQPHVAFLENLQGVVQLVRRDIPLFPEHIADAELARTRLVFDGAAEA